MKSLSRLLPLALLAVPFMACSSTKNHTERNASPEAQGRHPDYANLSQDELKQQCIGIDAGNPWPQVDADGDGKIDPPVCATPDPGSRVVSCAHQSSGYQFAWMWDLAADNKARATYTYDDNTTAFVVPDRVLAWEPPVDTVPNAAASWVCSDPDPAISALPFGLAVRFKGGPFTEYGGGFGQSFRTTSHNTDTFPASSHPGLGMLEATPSAEFPGPKTGAYDLSAWDGVAIWVRRGPLGMSTLRVGLTEKHSAEDLNSQAIVDYAAMSAPPLDATGVKENNYCRRWRLCGCAAGTPCTDYKTADGRDLGTYCFDPAVGTPPEGDLVISKVQSCGETRCKEKNTSTSVPDPLYAKTTTDAAGMMTTVAACNESLEDDGRVDNFCWDPKVDPKPPAKRQRCNNPFSKPITVTTDWQLIKVSFSELRQADEANVAADMDLKSVKQLVFTYGGGWTDFWIANVGFYRAVK